MIELDRERIRMIERLGSSLTKTIKQTKTQEREALKSFKRVY